MITPTRTTTALLDGLADPENEEIWTEFDARFRPILYGFGRRLGLGNEEAADAAQEALVCFLGAYRDGRYERGRGRLSSWLIGITQNCIRKAHDARRQRREHGLSSAGDLPDDDELGRIWDAECERALIREAIGRLKRQTQFNDRTIIAFEMLALRDKRPAEVADFLGMSRNDVYLAKHRCLTALRCIIDELTDAYEVNAS